MYRHNTRYISPAAGLLTYVTLDHKTNHKGQSYEIEIYTSSESWINKLFLIWNLRLQENLNIEKMAFKVVQMTFLAMHITNQKLSFAIFMVGNLLNIFTDHDLYLIS